MSDQVESENEVRALRDKIYGRCTDNNWDGCKAFWLKPEEIAWLKRQQPKSE